MVLTETKQESKETATDLALGIRQEVEDLNKMLHFLIIALEDKLLGMDPDDEGEDKGLVRPCTSLFSNLAQTKGIAIGNKELVSKLGKLIDKI